MNDQILFNFDFIEKYISRIKNYENIIFSNSNKIYITSMTNISKKKRNYVMLHLISKMKPGWMKCIDQCSKVEVAYLC